ncbi:MAG: glutamate racemase [Syntrophales bacterium]
MIGFFDSGFGGLTVLKHVVRELPRYNYLYLGDTARVPYGSRSDWIVYEFTRQAVDYLFKEGCHLIIIACNTASARALRKIQQEYLPKNFPDRRVLGVIRPSAEEVVERTNIHKVGILATEGVVAARSYVIEIQNLNPAIQVYQQACPLLVPIIEAGEQDWEGTDMIVERYLKELFEQDNEIDTLLLACTHYPILYRTFEKHVPRGVTIIEQGPLVARKLKDYLLRHPEIDRNLRKKGSRVFQTTDKSEKFDRLACRFYGGPVHSTLVTLDSLCTI